MPPAKAFRRNHLLTEKLCVKSIADSPRPLAIDAAWALRPTPVRAKCVPPDSAVATSLRERNAANTTPKGRQCALESLTVRCGEIVGN